jgi:2-(1,2-epoxy-1,2-dihydrophenyl)acetyl-CoA isomerase
MQSADGVRLEHDGPVLTVTLDRPERLNALDDAGFDALRAAWTVAADDAVRAVVVTGAGRGFCAGQELAGPARDVEAIGRNLRERYHPHVLAMAALDKPVIAAVNGPAAGAGLSLAGAADLRIASERAVFVPGFVTIGAVPDAGGGWFLLRLLGYSRAFDWLCSSRRLSAVEALEWGLVDEVVAHDDLLPRAAARAAELAAYPGRAVALTKRLLGGGLQMSLTEYLAAEAVAQEEAVAAPGRAEARATAVARHDEGTPDG